MARKVLTRDQAETAQRRAALFTRNVLRADDRAAEIEGESVDEWAQETERTITNPRRRDTTMPQVEDDEVVEPEADDILEQVADLTTSALDPHLTREEVIEIVQQIDELVNAADYADDDEDDTGLD